MGFCHCDLWSNNMLKKGDAIIAIDFETASTGVKRVKWCLGMLYFPKWMDFQREMQAYKTIRPHLILISYILFCDGSLVYLGRYVLDGIFGQAYLGWHILDGIFRLVYFSSYIWAGMSQMVYLGWYILDGIFGLVYRVVHGAIIVVYSCCHILQLRSFRSFFL